MSIFNQSRYWISKWTKVEMKFTRFLRFIRLEPINKNKHRRKKTFIASASLKSKIPLETFFWHAWNILQEFTNAFFIDDWKISFLFPYILSSAKRKGFAVRMQNKYYSCVSAFVCVWVMMKMRGATIFLLMYARQSRYNLYFAPRMWIRIVQKF